MVFPFWFDDSESVLSDDLNPESIHSSDSPSVLVRACSRGGGGGVPDGRAVQRFKDSCLQSRGSHGRSAEPGASAPELESWGPWAPRRDRAAVQRPREAAQPPQVAPSAGPRRRQRRDESEASDGCGSGGWEVAGRRRQSRRSRLAKGTPAFLHRPRALQLGVWHSCRHFVWKKQRSDAHNRWWQHACSVDRGGGWDGGGRGLGSVEVSVSGPSRPPVWLGRNGGRVPWGSRSVQSARDRRWFVGGSEGGEQWESVSRARQANNSKGKRRTTVGLGPDWVWGGGVEGGWDGPNGQNKGRRRGASKRDAAQGLGCWGGWLEGGCWVPGGGWGEPWGGLGVAGSTREW